MTTRLRFCWTFAVLLACVAAPLNAQFNSREKGRSQQLPDEDSSSLSAVSGLPDTILIARYDPRFPVVRTLVPDSALSLAYVRYDPLDNDGPDNLSLNSLGQPATPWPVLGNSYRRLVDLTLPQHPAYETGALPFFEQNVPFAYTAYDQGGEIDDGQIQVMFGRSFDDGWKLGVQYDRIYQGGERNRYPQSRAQRISLTGTVAHVPDSSRHRSYAWLTLNSYGFNNSGGIDFALLPDTSAPDDPFEAEAFIQGTISGPFEAGMRTEGRNSTYNVLHRVFLREQVDSTASGWAASLQARYDQRSHRTFVTQEQLALGEVNFSAYAVDDRGLRYALNDRSLSGEARLEYFTSPSLEGPVTFNFGVGLYGGQQRLESAFASTERLALLGLSGNINGTLLKRFRVEGEADFALGDRVGEGRLSGALSWTQGSTLAVGAEALLERSRAPWGVTQVGINDELVFSPDLPISTHTQLGGFLRYVPWGATARGFVDVYTESLVYGSFGEPREARGDFTVPTLELYLPVKLGVFRFDSRAVVRQVSLSADLFLPGYTGQHSLYASFPILDGAMQVLTGVDAHVRSPVRQYEYFPLTGVFTLPDSPREVDWQYRADFFLAFKVQSFKAFVRLDNFIVAQENDPPTSVLGYPLVRANAIGSARGILRLGVAFFLFN